MELSPRGTGREDEDVDEVRSVSRSPARNNGGLQRDMVDMASR